MFLALGDWLVITQVLMRMFRLILSFTCYASYNLESRINTSRAGITK